MKSNNHNANTYKQSTYIIIYANDIDKNYFQKENRFIYDILL